VEGMHMAAGILTSTGGMTSHAAVVARGWGKCCVAGAGAISINEKGRSITVDGKVQREKSPSMFVSVSDFQLDQFDIEGGDAIKEGEFAMLLAPDTGRFKLIWKALKIAFRGVRKGRDYVLLTGRAITVETRQSQRLVARDGEREKLSEPFEFRILSKALRVRVPAGDTAERAE